MADKFLEYPDPLWAGTQRSLNIEMEAHTKILNQPTANLLALQEEEPAPYLFEQHGSVGVINLAGPLTNRDSWFNRYYGVVSYAEVQKALMYAAEREEVKGILLNIDSGGGSVSGLSDTADLIARIDKSLKPVWSFTGGSMASAAYWLGSSGRKLFSSQTALLGSIGVIMVHMEYSKQLQEEGVGVNVLRAGKYKALLNSYEKASDEAIKQANEQMDATYDVFIGWVADRRGVTTQVADSTMGQGREFLGDKALKVGLSDGIETFSSVMTKFTKLLDSQNDKNDNRAIRGRVTSMPQALTEQQIAAIQGGVAPAAEAAPEQPTNPQAAPAPEATSTPAASPAAAPADEPKKDEVVALLEKQLDAANTAAIDSKVALKAAEDKLKELQASVEPLTKIVAGSVKTMKVALGAAATDLSGLSAAQLVVEHEACAKTFTEKFKANGVAAPSAPAADKTVAQPDPHHLARVSATTLKP